MTALVVRYIRVCCLLLLSAAAVCCCALADQKGKFSYQGMSQRASYSTLFTQRKLFCKVSNDKPNEHGRTNSAFWESVWKFSQQKNAVQPTPVQMSQLTPKSPVIFFRGKPILLVILALQWLLSDLPCKELYEGREGNTTLPLLPGNG